MDNKWIIEQADKLVRGMQRFSNECEHYRDMERQIDWTVYTELMTQIQMAMKNVDNE